MHVKSLGSALVILVLIEFVAIILLRQHIAASENLIYIVIFASSITSLLVYKIFRYWITKQGGFPTRQAMAEIGLGFTYGTLLATICIITFAWLGNVVSPSEITWSVLWKCLLLALFSGIIEEIISRGVLLFLLLKITRNRVTLANAVQATIFTLFHAGTSQFETQLYPLQVFIAGLLLGHMAIKTKALWMSIGFHTAWNFLNYLLFGIHKRLLSPVHGMLFGYPDTRLFVQIALVSMLVTTALYFCQQYYMRRRLER